MKRIFFYLLSFVVLVVGNAFAVSAETTSAALDLKAKSAILIEASTGNILYEKNANEPLPPASVTKIMTMLLAMEALDEGKIKLEDKVVCSEHAASMGGSQVFLEPGEQMSVNDLFKAIAVASGNDASVMMAEYIAGSETAFVEAMNAKAQLLGMKNTKFINCTGLEAPDHKTTANDIAIMSKELLKHKQIFTYTNIWMDTLRDGKFGLSNTNKLIRFYKDANGLKTGSTDNALYCISASALRNNMQLIAVVLASPTSKDRFADASKLLDYGFANWAVANELVNENIEPVKVLKGVAPNVKVTTSGEVNILVPKGKEKLLEKKIEMQKDVLAPVEKGQKLGEIIYTFEKKEVGRIPVKAAEEVKRAGFSHYFNKLSKILYS